jgi:hypothetical protein
MSRPYHLRQPVPVEERFWSRVTKTSMCWLWVEYTGRTGYGRLSRGGRKGALVLAHRLSWELAHGPIADGVHVLHRCDVRNCVRPTHLFLGTQGDNVADAVEKGRHRPPTPRRLDMRIVAEIRARRVSGETQQSIANDIGVSRSYISQIAAGKRWPQASRAPARRLRTHCRHGHAYDEANTYRDRRGIRYCRTCSRIRARRQASAVRGLPAQDRPLSVPQRHPTAAHGCV